MLRVKSDKSDWFWSQSIVFTQPFKTGMSLGLARGLDISSARQKGPLGTRLLQIQLDSATSNAATILNQLSVPPKIGHSQVPLYFTNKKESEESHISDWLMGPSVGSIITVCFVPSNSLTCPRFLCITVNHTTPSLSRLQKSNHHLNSPFQQSSTWLHLSEELVYWSWRLNYRQ